MAKAHLKRLAAPKTWPIPRKSITFITRPMPGPHAFSLGLPLSIIIRKLGLAKTAKEVRFLLNSKVVNVDGRRIRSKKYEAGLMDVLSIPEIKKHYRVLINRKNKIYLNEIDEKESKFKLRRVTGKTVLKGNRLQLNLHDSNNIITKEKVNVGDSVIFEFGKGITGKIELKEGNTAYLTGGKHVGLFGSIVKIIETKRRRDEIIIKVGDREIKTAKRHAFVVGEKEPKITLK